MPNEYDLRFGQILLENIVWSTQNNFCKEEIIKSILPHIEINIVCNKIIDERMRLQKIELDELEKIERILKWLT